MKTSDLGIVEEQTKKTQRTFLDSMDAIAYGVQAWFEENTGYSRRVSETTVDIALALGISEADIKRSASCRLIHDADKGRVIKSLLQRLQESCLDQADNKDTHTER